MTLPANFWTDALAQDLIHLASTLVGPGQCSCGWPTHDGLHVLSPKATEA